MRRAHVGSGEGLPSMVARHYYDQMHRLYRAVRELVPHLPDGSVDTEQLTAEYRRQVQRLGLAVPEAE